MYTVIPTRDRQHYGIQYHPESFATENGEQIINNFIKLQREKLTMKLLEEIKENKHLTEDDMKEFINLLLNPKVSNERKIEILTLLYSKGNATK